MNRIEIIANVALEEDLFELMKSKGAGKYYTRMNNVHGEGCTEPKMGSAVWPEENFVLIMFCEEEETNILKESVLELRSAHQLTGIQMFIIPGVQGG